jgi:protein-S-isoprenylcysteine O-methyltransferase Ste14
LLGSFALYVFAPEWMEWAAFPTPAWVRWAGAAVALGCVPLLWWVLRSIGRNISETVLTKKDHQLVTSGPYRWVRHPLYAVALVQILSLGVLARNWLIVVLGLFGVVVFRFVVIPKEETNLIKAFGDRYVEYTARTGALVPRIRF